MITQKKMLIVAATVVVVAVVVRLWFIYFPVHIGSRVVKR